MSTPSEVVAAGIAPSMAWYDIPKRLPKPTHNYPHESWKHQLRDRLGQWIDMGTGVRWFARGTSRQGVVIDSPKAGLATVEEAGTKRRVNVPTSRLTAFLESPSGSWMHSKPDNPSELVIKASKPKKVSLAVPATKQAKPEAPVRYRMDEPPLITRVEKKALGHEVLGAAGVKSLHNLRRYGVKAYGGWTPADQGEKVTYTMARDRALSALYSPKETTEPKVVIRDLELAHSDILVTLAMMEPGPRKEAVQALDSMVMSLRARLAPHKSRDRVKAQPMSRLLAQALQPRVASGEMAEVLSRMQVRIIQHELVG